MVEVVLKRGNKVHQSSQRYFWTWETKQDGQGIWKQSKWEAIDDWKTYADMNEIKEYKFVQKLPEVVK